MGSLKKVNKNKNFDNFSHCTFYFNELVDPLQGDKGLNEHNEVNLYIILFHVRFYVTSTTFLGK